MDDKDLAQLQSTEGPQAGQIYRHYKGGLYTVVARAIKEDTLEPLVIYQSNARGTVWARTLANFAEEVHLEGLPYPTPRFIRVLERCTRSS